MSKFKTMTRETFEMKEFVDMNLGNRKEVLTFEEYVELWNTMFESVKEEGATGIDLKYDIKLSETVQKYFSFHKVYENLTKEQVKKIIEIKYSLIFQDESFKTATHKEVIFHPVYHIINGDMFTLAVLGHRESFKYLLDNIELQSFDIDMLCITNAVKHGHDDIVQDITNYVNEGHIYDGSTGHFAHRLKEVIMEDYVKLNKVSQKALNDTFEWFELPDIKLEEVFEMSQVRENNNNLTRLKETFPDLNI